MPMSVILPFTVVCALSAMASPEDKPVAVHFMSEGRTVHGLLWGKGFYGVILKHGAMYDAASWTPLAVDIAKNEMVALALEEFDPDDILAANLFLSDKYGVKATGLIARVPEEARPWRPWSGRRSVGTN